MGADPNKEAIASASASVDEAVKEGTKTEKSLLKRGGKYRDWAGDTQGEMMGF